MHEAGLRCIAGIQNMSKFSKCWGPTGNNRQNNIMFKSNVASAMSSALDSFAPLHNHFNKLDSLQAKFARRVIGGAQMHQSSEHITVLFKKQVLSKLNLAPISI